MINLYKVKWNTPITINIKDNLRIIKDMDSDNISLSQNNSSIKETGLVTKNKEMHKYFIRMGKSILGRWIIIKDQEIIVFINGKMELK